ncbi:MAG: TetR family transcriptional regulator [Pseudomonadota bacterium]
MSARTSTPDRILEAARKLFNSKGYATTSLSEIAASVGISQGNLTYHFPSKSDLAVRLQSAAQDTARQRRQNKQDGAIAEDYVEHLIFAMNLTWNNRFLLRDRTHFAEKISASTAEFEADYAELHNLLKRVEAEGLFRKEAIADLPTLARSIWIMSRYWIDYLRDIEHKQEISWTDQERGIQHHLALLFPCLTQSAQRQFQSALEHASHNSPAAMESR